MWIALFRLIQVGLRAAMTAAGRGAAAGTTLRVGNLGRVVFVGLINRRPLVELGQQQIRNAFAKVGLREAHNSHFVSRLIERGPTFGIRTLDDFARALNGAAARVGKDPSTIELVLPGRQAALVLNKAGELVTFLPL